MKKNVDTGWTQEKRRYLFTRLLEKFGPASTWGGTVKPKGRHVEYDELLSEIADFFNRQRKLSERQWAVNYLHVQVIWAVSPGIASIVNKDHHRNYILNRAAALEVGLISRGDLSPKVIMENMTQKRKMDYVKG